MSHHIYMAFPQVKQRSELLILFLRFCVAATLYAYIKRILINTQAMCTFDVALILCHGYIRGYAFVPDERGDTRIYYVIFVTAMFAFVMFSYFPWRCLFVALIE